jgi:hypothetical protein
MSNYSEFDLPLRTERLIRQLQKDGLGAWVHDPYISMVIHLGIGETISSPPVIPEYGYVKALIEQIARRREAAA